eukprot:6184202-Pleurochrysis_carterae.AAC.2
MRVLPRLRRSVPRLFYGAERARRVFTQAHLLFGDSDYLAVFHDAYYAALRHLKQGSWYVDVHTITAQVGPQEQRSNRVGLWAAAAAHKSLSFGCIRPISFKNSHLLGFLEHAGIYVSSRGYESTVPKAGSYAFELAGHISLFKAAAPLCFTGACKHQFVRFCRNLRAKSTSTSRHVRGL